MAVMYSKLGGCLGVTAKLGPLAKTDLWAGVKGLLERFMTHLGLGSSLEEPWGGLLGGWMCCFPGRWCWPPGKPELTYCWGAPIALPGSPSCVASLTCLGGPKGVRVGSGLSGGICLRRSDSFPGIRRESGCRGSTGFPRRESCSQRWASFPGRESCCLRCTSFPGRER